MEPTFCSALIDKLCGKSKNKSLKKSDDSNKGPRISNEKIETDDIKVSIRKLQRVTMLLPLVLRTNDAFEEGLQKCEICAMTCEAYKKEMQNLKVIELLVDGVIEKEQIELINEEGGKTSTTEKRPSKKPSVQAKGNKISFGLEVYCEKDEIKHNLKCILIMLQRNIGNFIVQVCYVKTRNMEHEEKNKDFSISVSDLKVLKYEHSNLTDKIISLFKGPVPSKGDGPKICLACIKEKLTDYNLKLSSVLKMARHLNLVMKNANANRDDNNPACCSRDYPHIHAECQNKPVVLKYTQPFTPVDPAKTKNHKGTAESKPYGQPKKEADTKGPRGSSDLSGPAQKRKSEETEPNKSNAKPKKKKKPPPSNELQTGVEEPSSEVEEPNVSPTKQQEVTPGGPTKIKSDESGKSKKLDSKVDTPEEEDCKRDEDNSLNGDPTESKSDESGKFKKVDCKTDTPEKEDRITDEDNPQKENPKNVKTEEDEEEMKNIYPMDEDSKSEGTREPQEDELYCGCNFENVYNELGIVITSKSNTPPKTEESTSEVISDISSTDSYLKENETPYKKPTVQFQTYHVNVGSPKPVLSIPQEKISHYSNDTIRNRSDKEQFDIPKREHHALSVTAVDSVLLTKQRLSISDHLSKKDRHSMHGEISSGSISKPHTLKYSHNVKKQLNEICSIPQSSEIRHQNKKVEQVLQLVGKENLLFISSPADCCTTNSSLTGQENVHLPMSVSLNSLPLDNEDLNYISKVAGKQNPQIMIMSDEELAAKEYKWEIDPSVNDLELDMTKWTKAFQQKEISTIDCESTKTPPQTSMNQEKKIPVKTHMTEEDMQLPTIREEELDTEDKIPFMPSVRSLPMDEEEKKCAMKNGKHSVINNTVELRYFTIELPKMLNCVIKQKQWSDSRPYANRLTNCKVTNLEKDETRNIKGVNQNNLNSNIMSYDSFHSCCSSSEILNKKNIPPDDLKVVKVSSSLKHSPLNVVDEMIMMNVIYLNRASKEKKHIKQTKSFDQVTSNNIGDFAKQSHDIGDSTNTTSYKIPQISLNNTNLSLEYFKATSINSKYGYSDRVNKEKNVKLQEINNTPELKKQHLSDKYHKINTSQTYIKFEKNYNIYSTELYRFHNLTKESEEFNLKSHIKKKSYTILKNNNYNYLNASNNMKLKKYEHLTNHCPSVSNKKITVNKRSSLNKASINVLKNKRLCENRIQNMANKHNQQWQKLNIKKTNVKDYIRSFHLINGNNIYSTRFKDHRRNLFFPIKSRIDYNRTICKVKLSDMKYAELYPVRVEAQIPVVTYMPSTLSNMYEVNYDKFVFGFNNNEVKNISFDEGTSIEGNILNKGKFRTTTIKHPHHLTKQSFSSIDCNIELIECSSRQSQRS